MTLPNEPNLPDSESENETAGGAPSLQPDLEAMLAAARPGGQPEGPTRCGLIAIVGRPNVGKSTLMNSLIGQKVSITSRKAQTTRHRITGIATDADTQFVFVDTPGFQTRHTVKGTAALNRNLNKTVQSVLGDVDVVLFLVDAGRFGLEGEDQAVTQYVKEYRLDVFRTDEVAASQPGVRAGATVQGNRAARTGAVADPFGQLAVVLGGGACGHYQLHQVLLHGVGHVQTEDFLARGKDRFLADLLRGFGLAVQGLATCLLENLALYRGIGKTDAHMHEETIELGFRQGIGAFLLDRVLRRHDQEQWRQRIGTATHRDLALGHGLEQR